MNIQLESTNKSFIIQPRIIELLQSASSALVGEFELGTLLQNVVESYREISKASACSIFLIDELENKLVMKAGSGYSQDLKGIAKYNLSVNPNTPKIGLTAWIALVKQKFSAKTREELTSHPAWKGTYDGEQYKGDERCESFIGVPLIVRDKVIGVLKAENKIPDKEHPEPYFTPDEEQSFEILANTVAIAIENVKLIEKQRKSQSLQIAKSIHKVSSAVVGRFELHEILKSIVETFKEISNATACAIFLVDDDRRHIRMRAGIGYEKDLRHEAEYNLTVDPNASKIGLTAWIVLTKQKFSAKTRKELTNHPAWRGKYDGEQYKGDERCESFIGVPLIIRDEVIGLLKAENKIIDEFHPEPYFTPEEEQVFEILSNIAAVVVRNATLITEEEKQRIDRIVSLYRIGALLQEQKDIERLIYIFLTGLTHSKMIGFNRAMYFQYEPILKQLIGKMAIGPYNKKEGERIRREMEITGHSLSIENCIRNFDEKRETLSNKLNLFVSKTLIDLKKDDLCLELADKGKNTFKECEEQLPFSPNLKQFLKDIEAEKTILIGFGHSKERYNFVICDNIYDQKPFDQTTKDLLIVFIGQISNALERLQSIENLKVAREAAWQEVSAMTAHRLGNILPFTENRLKEIQKLNKDNISLQKLLESCDEDIKIAINVIKDFKGFATAGKISLSYVDNVNNVLKQIDPLLKTNFKDVKILTAYLEQKVIPYIQVDLDAIKIVFFNLLTNTKDVNPKNPIMKIWVGIPSDEDLKNCGLPLYGNFVKIVYEDNGPGIPGEEKEKIFEAFFTHKPGNTGLGLAIVKRIIIQHGGIIFEDGEYNKGVRFNIILPIIRQEVYYEKNQGKKGFGY